MNASSSECTRTRQVPGVQRGLQTCIDSEFNYAKTFVCMRICAYGRDGAIFVQEEAARPAGQCNIHDKYFNFAFPHHFMEIQMAAAANFPFGFPIVLSAFWAFDQMSAACRGAGPVGLGLLNEFRECENSSCLFFYCLHWISKNCAINSFVYTRRRFNEHEGTWPTKKHWQYF